jgi:hypothetical protein
MKKKTYDMLLKITKGLTKTENGERDKTHEEKTSFPHFLPYLLFSFYPIFFLWLKTELKDEMTSTIQTHPENKTKEAKYKKWTTNF